MPKRCTGVHYVGLGESFSTSIYLQMLASIQPRTRLVQFARSPRTDPPSNPEGLSGVQSFRNEGPSSRVLNARTRFGLVELWMIRTTLQNLFVDTAENGASKEIWPPLSCKAHLRRAAVRRTLTSTARLGESRLQLGRMQS